MTANKNHHTQLKKKNQLDRLEVRPITEQERERWDTLMAEHHYLGFRKLVGESARYLAHIEGRWVALLGWAGAAYKSRHREAWIGWSSEQRIKRLKYIVNNSRFLILPGVDIKNLASKTLALNLHRISQDWIDFYQHPVVVAETFVDHNRFKGSCYKAAGFKVLGTTQGYGRNAGRYYRHEQQKTIFIRALQPNAQKLLSAPFLTENLTGIKPVVDLNELQIESLVKKLSELEDPRDRGSRFRYASILAVGIFARLSGLRSYLHMSYWAKKLTQNQLQRFGSWFDENQRKYLPPSEPTLRRAFQAADNKKLFLLVASWLNKQVPTWVTAARPVKVGKLEPAFQGDDICAR